MSDAGDDLPSGDEDDTMPHNVRPDESDDDDEDQEDDNSGDEAAVDAAEASEASSEEEESSDDPSDDDSDGGLQMTTSAATCKKGASSFVSKPPSAPAEGTSKPPAAVFPKSVSVPVAKPPARPGSSNAGMAKTIANAKKAFLAKASKAKSPSTAQLSIAASLSATTTAPASAPPSPERTEEEAEHVEMPSPAASDKVDGVRSAGDGRRDLERERPPSLVEEEMGACVAPENERLQPETRPVANKPVRDEAQIAACQFVVWTDSRSKTITNVAHEKIVHYCPTDDDGNPIERIRMSVANFKAVSTKRATVGSEIISDGIRAGKVASNYIVIEMRSEYNEQTQLPALALGIPVIVESESQEEIDELFSGVADMSKTVPVFILEPATVRMLADTPGSNFPASIKPGVGNRGRKYCGSKAKEECELDLPNLGEARPGPYPYSLDKWWKIKKAPKKRSSLPKEPSVVKRARAEAEATQNYVEAEEEAFADTTATDEVSRAAKKSKASSSNEAVEVREEKKTYIVRDIPDCGPIEIPSRVGGQRARSCMIQVTYHM